MRGTAFGYGDEATRILCSLVSESEEGRAQCWLVVGSAVANGVRQEFFYLAEEPELRELVDPVEVVDGRLSASDRGEMLERASQGFSERLNRLMRGEGAPIHSFGWMSDILVRHHGQYQLFRDGTLLLRPAAAAEVIDSLFRAGIELAGVDVYMGAPPLSPERVPLRTKESFQWAGGLMTSGEGPRRGAALDFVEQVSDDCWLEIFAGLPVTRVVIE